MEKSSKLSHGELRAVGIRSDGALLAIRSADSMRGIALTGIIVSLRHRTWYKKNEATLQACFVLNHPRGQIIMFGGADSIMEVL